MKSFLSMMLVVCVLACGVAAAAGAEAAAEANSIEPLSILLFVDDTCTKAVREIEFDHAKDCAALSAEQRFNSTLIKAGTANSIIAYATYPWMLSRLWVVRYSADAVCKSADAVILTPSYDRNEQCQALKDSEKYIPGALSVAEGEITHYRYLWK